MRLKLTLSLLVLYLILSPVLAYNKMCDFNGTVRLNKSDLLPYFSDQTGCGIQKMQDGSGLLIVATFCVFILIFIYGLSRRK